MGLSKSAQHSRSVWYRCSSHAVLVTLLRGASTTCRWYRPLASAAQIMSCHCVSVARLGTKCASNAEVLCSIDEPQVWPSWCSHALLPCRSASWYFPRGPVKSRCDCADACKLYSGCTHAWRQRRQRGAVRPGSRMQLQVKCERTLRARPPCCSRPPAVPVGPSTGRALHRPWLPLATLERLGRARV